MREIQSVSDALTLAYISDPCRIQATTLWKTIQQIEIFHSEATINYSEFESIAANKSAEIVLSMIGML